MGFEGDHFPARRAVPKLDFAAERAHGESFTVGRKGECADPTGVAFETVSSARRNLIKEGCAFRAAHGQPMAVWRKGELSPHIRMSDASAIKDALFGPIRR